MSLKVLLVEDEQDVAEPLARALKYARHRVTIAADGREALSLVLGSSFDLVLLDVRMPTMDGVTFLSIMRSYLRLFDLPVFLITALPPGDRQIEEAQRLGVQQVFRKGKYALDDLLTAVAEVGATSG